MEKILRIEEHTERIDLSDMKGYAITTNEQVIKLLIDSRKSGLENWGYFLSEDNLSEFIGAELHSIKITDTELKEGSLEQRDIDLTKHFEGGVMFVDLNTSRGVLQFVAYNDHNGFYGHDAMVISKQLNHEECL